MTTPSAPAASPLFLREEEVRRGLDLLHFGSGVLAAAPASVLARHGLGRAHGRALTFLARRPDGSVGELFGLLGITKQSLARVLAELSARGLVEQRAGLTDRRRSRLRLTEAGRTIEAEIFAAVRARLATAYARAGQDSVTGFWRVLEGLLGDEERDRLASLGRPG